MEDAIMRLHGHRHGDPRPLLTVLSSYISTDSCFLTQFRKFYRNWRKRNSCFLAKKSPMMTQDRRFLRSVTLKRRRHHVSSRDSERTPRYKVGDTDSTSTTAESGAITADPKGGHDAHEGLLVPQDLCPAVSPKKRKAPTSKESQTGSSPPPKRAAVRDFGDSHPSLKDAGCPELGTPEVETPGFWWQRNIYNLSPEQLHILRSKGQEGMVSDDIIQKAQELLQCQYPEYDGLQPTAALLVPGYSVITNAVQIHYDEDRAHWLTTGFRNGHILVADSINTCNLCPSICEQINNIYGLMVNEPLKHLRFLTVDPYDCGLFAIAFAYELLADDGDPTAIFHHEKIRKHLISCLQTGRITGLSGSFMPPELPEVLRNIAADCILRVTRGL